MKPTIPEVLPRFRAYVRRPENGVGGPLHLWLSEPNYCDGAMRDCEILARLRGDSEGVELARIGLSMSKTQRRKIHHQVWCEDEG